jgi:hypothetical protein
MVTRFGSVEGSGRFERFVRVPRLRSLGVVSDHGFRGDVVRGRGAKADDTVVGPVDSRVVLVKPGFAEDDIGMCEGSNVHIEFLSDATMISRSRKLESEEGVLSDVDFLPVGKFESRRDVLVQQGVRGRGSECGSDEVVGGAGVDKGSSGAAMDVESEEEEVVGGSGEL